MSILSRQGKQVFLKTSYYKCIFSSSSPSNHQLVRFLSTNSNPLNNESGKEHVRIPPRRRFSLSNIIDRFLIRSNLTTDTDVSRFLARTATYSIYALIGMTALGTLGIDTTPLLTGIGVTGFTLGFALKEIATNFLSGVLLVLGKPFEKGQWIKVLAGGNEGKMEGEVVSIDARYVLLRTKMGGKGKDEDGMVMVPSVMVYTNPIIVSKNITSKNITQ